MPAYRKFRCLKRNLLTAVVTLAIAFVAATARGEVDDLLGPWHGSIDTPAGPLTVIVTVARGDDGVLTAGFEVPAQAPGVTIPTDGVTFEGDRFSFRVPRAAARFEGQLNADAARIEGIFAQGIEMPLSLVPGRPQAVPIEGLDGRWSGRLVRGETTLRLVLNIATSDTGTFATLDSPDQAATGIPVTDLSRTGETVGFRIPAASVAYDGQLDSTGKRLCGSWTRPGYDDTEVCFEHGTTSAAAERPRPQEPAETVPYRSIEVRVPNPAAPGVELAGTLTLPEGNGPFPAAVLITGSGPQDRDESVMGHRPFLVLADHLTRRGIAVLRYDDRGFGESKGDFWAATTRDFAADAAAAARWLAERGEIDADRVGLIGHSEGGLAAPIAAGIESSVSWTVLLAAPGVDMIELIAAQTRLMALAQGISESRLARMMPINRQIWHAVADAGDESEARRALTELLTDDVLAELGASPDRRPVVIENAVRPWLMELLRFDPAPDLKALDIPVLAINGSLDLQVPADQNLPAMRAALAGNSDATVLELPGLNHLFQTATTGSIAEYRELEETFAPAALEVISAWILDRFGNA